MSVGAPTVHLVTRKEQLDELLDAMAEADYLPLDTEFVRERTYFPRLALLQIATPGTVWLVDPLAGLDLSPLWERIVSTDKPVVLHAADQDLDLILTAAGRLPRQVFDTQIAAELLGIGAQLSYAALVEKLLGIALDKAQVRSDWLARPLSEAQWDYAVQDVFQLGQIFPLLHERLARTGRLEWMAEETARQTDPARFAPADQRRWKKVRGVQTLNRAGLAVLRPLTACREQLARERDLPRRWVWRDEALLELARAIAGLPHPVDPGQITPMLETGRSPLRGDDDRIRRLADAIARELDRPPSHWPELRRGPALPPEDRELLKSRRNRLEQLAERESICPSRLATSTELKHHLANPDRPSRLNQGWRADLLAPVLRDACQPDSP
ncbi:ribonuclease D [Guyparkeria sp.]|uniref:ribonuclease D n=1 Tax=Guyparkeria sp. TaxID=2035736 RepID=UPI0039707381